MRSPLFPLLKKRMRLISPKSLTSHREKSHNHHERCVFDRHLKKIAHERGAYEYHNVLTSHEITPEHRGGRANAARAKWTHTKRVRLAMLV